MNKVQIVATSFDYILDISNRLIQECDCSEFTRLNGLDFDSQDLRELGCTACPACGKPFTPYADAVGMEDQWERLAKFTVAT